MDIFNILVVTAIHSLVCTHVCMHTPVSCNSAESLLVFVSHNEPQHQSLHSLTERLQHRVTQLGALL